MVQVGFEFELILFQAHRCWDYRHALLTIHGKMLIHVQFLPLIWGTQDDCRMGTEDNVNGPRRDVRESSQNSTPEFLMIHHDNVGAQVLDP